MQGSGRGQFAVRHLGPRDCFRLAAHVTKTQPDPDDGCAKQCKNIDILVRGSERKFRPCVLPAVLWKPKLEAANRFSPSVGAARHCQRRGNAPTSFCSQARDGDTRADS